VVPGESPPPWEGEAPAEPKVVGIPSPSCWSVFSASEVCFGGVVEHGLHSSPRGGAFAWNSGLAQRKTFGALYSEGSSLQQGLSGTCCTPARFSVEPPVSLDLSLLSQGNNRVPGSQAETSVSLARINMQAVCQIGKSRPNFSAGLVCFP
jgi:hypothetical protein